MEQNEILASVQEIFRDVLDNEEIVLTPVMQTLLPMILKNGIPFHISN